MDVMSRLADSQSVHIIGATATEPMVAQRMMCPGERPDRMLTRAPPHVIAP